MAKQTLGQGDSNVVVRNQVVYGALPQDVIDRMGDTTLALQTTEQNVLPAINELKSNLTDLIKTKSYNGTTTDTGVIAVTDLTANNIIPIQVTTSINNCYHIFGTNSSGKLAIRFTDSGGASKASTAISGTVYYIEI